MSAAVARSLSALRENAFAWSVGLASVLAVAALVVSEVAAEPGWWRRAPDITFLQGLLIGALLVVVPLGLLVRRNAELRAMQRELTHTVESTRTAFYTWNVREGRAKGWGKLRSSFGMPTDAPEFVPDTWIGIIHPDDIEVYRTALRDHFKGRTAKILVDYRIEDRHGDYLWVRDKAVSTRDASGDVEIVSGTIEEITELKETELALRESEARATLALLASDSRIWRWDIDAGTVYRTPRCAEILGVGEDEVSGDAGWWLDRIHEEDVDAYTAAVRAHLKGETDRFECEYRVRRTDGSYRWVLDRGLALRNDSGRAYRMAGAMEDITERRSTEEALRRTQATLRAFLDNAPFDMSVKDASGRYLLFNRAVCDRFRVEEADVVGKLPSEFMSPKIAGLMMERDVEMLGEGGPTYHESVHALPDGHSYEMQHVRFPIRGDDGTTFGIGAIAQDVTEARAAEREVRNQREQLRAMADALPASIVYITPDYRIGFINSTAETWWGLKRDDVVGRSIREVRGEKLFDELSRTVDQVFDGHALSVDVDLDCADGVARRIDRRYVPHRDPEGNVVGVYGMSIDVTEQHAVAERLRQSQKMEAVGNLTGGIAHDFNNLMFAVAGNLEFLEEELTGSTDGPCLRFVRNARKGVSRAADLTARLLAFSRRQTLRPETVEIVKLFGELQELLRRTLPENIDIDTEVSIEGGSVRIDASQLESALLNLAINARDAMPEGGDLTFRIGRAGVGAAGFEEGGEERGANGRATDSPCSPAPNPGDYIRIQVQDTGCGMPPEIVSKAFEPFFTTKEIGQGTGLGLSMVLGFVEQSGGFVEVDSRVGGGTTISLFLPVSEEDARAADRETETAAVAGPQGCVLLVEDDDMVREVAALYLANLGYDVTTERDGVQALTRLEGGARFDLILSDVMMPNGLSGVGLAEAARARNPDQPFLLMTGYADGNTPSPTGAAGDIPVLLKPFTKATLADAVAAALKPDEAGIRRRSVSAA